MSGGKSPPQTPREWGILVFKSTRALLPPLPSLPPCSLLGTGTCLLLTCMPSGTTGQCTSQAVGPVLIR